MFSMTDMSNFLVKDIGDPPKHSQTEFPIYIQMCIYQILTIQVMIDTIYIYGCTSVS
jgi:hypothetical protein